MRAGRTRLVPSHAAISRSKQGGPWLHLKGCFLPFKGPAASSDAALQFLCAYHRHAPNASRRNRWVSRDHGVREERNTATQK